MPVPVIDRMDHLVLTARDIETTCRFYVSVLGMIRETFDGGRVALRFGRQKINVHPYPSPIDLIARTAEPGTLDVCFVTETPLAEVVAHLETCGVAVIAGPGEQSGAEGKMQSVYFRDPDGNLIEVSNYPAG
ncbi:MAG: VOC family protein [Kiloniellales bacterium]|nr:VOC family protein [Kiloniellales bacterium]